MLFCCSTCDCFPATDGNFKSMYSFLPACLPACLPSYPPFTRTFKRNTTQRTFCPDQKDFVLTKCIFDTLGLLTKVDCACFPTTAPPGQLGHGPFPTACESQTTPSFAWISHIPSEGLWPLPPPGPTYQTQLKRHVASDIWGPGETVVPVRHCSWGHTT